MATRGTATTANKLSYDFLFWIFYQQRSFCKLRKAILKFVTSPQCKVYVTSRNSQYRKFEARKLFQRMPWVSISHWFGCVLFPVCTMLKCTFAFKRCNPKNGVIAAQTNNIFCRPSWVFNAFEVSKPFPYNRLHNNFLSNLSLVVLMSSPPCNEGGNVCALAKIFKFKCTWPG